MGIVTLLNYTIKREKIYRVFACKIIVKLPPLKLNVLVY